MTTVYERHMAIVTDNDDPEQRFRIRVASATLMGTDANDEAVEYGDWLEPTFPLLLGTKGERASAGWFAVPSIGVTVEIEVAVSSSYDESPGQTMITGPDPKWRASLLQVGDTVPDEFKTNYPDRFGFKSASGHLLIFDDSKGDLGKVMLAGRPAKEGQPQSFISLEDNGSIQIATREQQVIFLNAKEGELTILDKHKNMISMKPDGITIMSANGHTINLSDGGVDVLAAGNLTLQGNAATLKGGAVALGGVGATEPVLKGAAFNIELAAELALISTAIGVAGGVYTPTVGIGSSSLSAKVKTE